MKIAYIINGLYNPAGMERVLTIRANYLCEFYDITFITYAQGERPDYFPLDKRIKRVDIDDKKGKAKSIQPIRITPDAPFFE